MSCKCNKGNYTKDTSQNIEFNTSMQGMIAIHVATPNFALPNFNPVVYVEDNEYEVKWGDTRLFNDLTLEKYYDVGAYTYTIDGVTYTPSPDKVRVQATKEDYPVVTFTFEESDTTEGINYIVNHELVMEKDRSKLYSMTIKNMGSNPIYNWSLDCCFGGNEQIVEAWNASYTQNNQMVTLKDDGSNPSILPQDTASCMLEIENVGSNLELYNVLLNEQAAVNTTGTILVYIDNPTFNKYRFIPEVTVNGGNNTSVMWGTAEMIGGLPLNTNLNIDATIYECDNITYYPVITEDCMMLDGTNPRNVYIKYYMRQQAVDLQYTVDYDLSEYTTGFVCTVTINNLTADDINGWEFDFEFLNNQDINGHWSSSVVQTGNKVNVKPASWNTIIRGNSSISFGFMGENPSKINYPTNPMLNGVTPVPRMATLEIELVRPSFPADEFTPTITLDGETVSISYGQTVSQQVVAQTVHDLKASTKETDMEAYLANNQDTQIFIEPGKSNKIVIEYYKALNNPNVFSGYFGTWADYGANISTETQLGSLAPYVTIIPLAFAKPYMEYTGSDYDLDHLKETVGIEFGYSAQLLKESIATLRKRSPYAAILLSLGGANYNEWEKLNPKSVAKFIEDFGLDGVDIDYEENVTAANCAPDRETGLVHCETDDAIIKVIRELRAVLPKSKGYIISFSAWSVGAYGEGKYVDAPPSHLTTTGVMLTPLREAGSDMDLMNVMAYNAVVVGQPEYVPEQAGEAYKTYFPGGLVAIGAHVPPDDNGSDYWSVSNVVSAARFARDNKLGGMMLWYLQRKGEIAGDSNIEIAEAIRENLGFPSYPGPLYYGAENDD